MKLDITLAISLSTVIVHAAPIGLPTSVIQSLDNARLVKHLDKAELREQFGEPLVHFSADVKGRIKDAGISQRELSAALQRFSDATPGKAPEYAPASLGDRMVPDPTSWPPRPTRF